MPSTGLTLTNTFGPLPGPVLLSQLDTNYSQLATVVNTLASQGNYFIDSGAANALVITVPAPLIFSLVAGLPIQVKVAATNTGASTIAINGGAAQALKNQDGSAMIAGQLKVNGIYEMMYDGTNFQVTGGGVAIATYPQTPAEQSAGVTLVNLNYPELNINRYKTNTTPGTTDMTSAIAAAKAVALQYSGGAEIDLGSGIIGVTEIDLTSSSAVFTKCLHLKGHGRFVTKIVPIAAGNVLINLMGTNDAFLENFSIDSSAFTSQAAIFMARSTTSTNCNNNKFFNVFTTGSYSVGAIVCNGSESSYFIGGRFENTNASANYCCFWTGGGSGVKALQNITTVNGGTILDTGNPNTDNKMVATEFYAPFNSAYPVRFSTGGEWEFFGSTIICGSSNNCRLITYGDITGISGFVGPISWNGCHYEVFGTGNTIHYLNAGGANKFFQGINNYGGVFTVSSNTAAIDFDRTTVAEQPYLVGSTWTTPSPSNSSTTGTTAYLYGLWACSFSLKPTQADGTLYVFGFLNGSSVVDVNFFNAGNTRYVGSQHSSIATALPTTGHYTVGETIYRETPVVGQPVGWKCTVSGTLGTLNGGATTGSITTGTNVLTVNTTTGMSIGDKITVAGSSGGPYYVRAISGTTVYLDSNAGATVAGAAVAFSNATLVALANL